MNESAYTNLYGISCADLVHQILKWVRIAKTPLKLIQMRLKMSDRNSIHSSQDPLGSSPEIGN